MKRPPNIAIAGIVAILGFCAILVVKQLVTAKSHTPWLTDEAAAFERARAEDKAVAIEFRASWSVPSMEMSDRLDKLRDTIDQDFIPLRVDVSNDDDRSRELRERYHAQTLPAVIFVNTDGKTLGGVSQLVDDTTLREEIAVAASRRRRD